MTPEQTITAYRDTAAKLAEALATTDRERAYLTAVKALLPILALDAHSERQSDAYQGVAFCSEWALFVANHRGWRWITEAVRLRLLAEALILDHGERTESPAREGWRVHLEYRADLGSLVREVLATSPTAATRAEEAD
jgi:hypothetical protein